MSTLLCNTDEDPGKEAMYLKLMRDERVSGIVLSPTQKTSNNFIEITNSHLPVVFEMSKSTGAFRALRESALKIPEKIAFATFDETPWSTPMLHKKDGKRLATPYVC